MEVTGSYGRRRPHARIEAPTAATAMRRPTRSLTVAARSAGAAARLVTMKVETGLGVATATMMRMDSTPRLLRRRAARSRHARGSAPLLPCVVMALKSSGMVLATAISGADRVRLVFPAGVSVCDITTPAYLLNLPLLHWKERIYPQLIVPCRWLAVSRAKLQRQGQAGTSYSCA